MMDYQKFVLRMSRPTPRSLSEALKNAEYATAITRPSESEYSVFWGLLGALVAVAIFGYGFWLTINRF